MQNILNLIIPILSIILIGYAAGKFKILKVETSDILTRFLFFFCLPSLTFSNIYQSKLEDLLNYRFLFTFLSGMLIVITLQYLLYNRLFHIRGQELVMLTMGGFYANIVYMGVPVTSLILSSVIPPLIALFLQASFFFPLSIFLMDQFCEPKPKRDRFGTILLVVKNPILIASFLAILSLVLKIHYPQFLISTFELMGKPAATTGLFVLGFTSNLPAGSMISKHEMKMALIASFFKVIVQPLIAFLIGRYLFRLDAWWLSAAVICSMLPTAVNHFIVSQKYHSCGNESRLIILFTTIGFCIMISFYLLIFGVIQ
jgi:malonate transporter